jgi:hypothetical protein
MSEFKLMQNFIVSDQVFRLELVKFASFVSFLSLLLDVLGYHGQVVDTKGTVKHANLFLEVNFRLSSSQDFIFIFVFVKFEQIFSEVHNSREKQKRVWRIAEIGNRNP